MNEKIKTCPRCGENSLQVYFSEPNGPRYPRQKCVKCLVCGYFSDLETWDHGAIANREGGLVRRVRRLESLLEYDKQRIASFHTEKEAAVQAERERTLWLLDTLMARFEPWSDEWDVARLRRDVESGIDPRMVKE